MVITPDGTGMWMGSNRGTDRTRLVRVDLTTGEETEVDSHPELDLDPRAVVSPIMPPPLIQDRRTGELLGVRYLGERQVIHALDPHFADVLANVEKLSDGDAGRLSSDEDGQRWVVGFNQDRDPGATYLYDHGTGESRLLFRPLPHLEPDQLAPMRPVTMNRLGFDAGFMVEVSPVGTPGFERSRPLRIPRAGRSPGRCAGGGC